MKDIEHLLPHFDSLIPFYQDKKLFITGGTGFFGKWILEVIQSLRNKKGLDLQVTVLSRDPDSFADRFPELANGINFLKGDISQIPESGPFDLMIHAATPADLTFNNDHPDKMLDCLIDGARQVCVFAKKAKIKRILHTSSGAVYGRQPYSIDRIDETQLMAPSTNLIQSAYGEGKRITELYGSILAHQQGIDFINARCFAFAGRYLPTDGTYAFGNFIRDAINGKTILIKGDGSPLRSYLYGADLVLWLLTLMALGKSNEHYNVGSDQAISIKDLAMMIAKKSSTQVEILGQNRTKNIERYVPSIEKAKQIGLRVYTPLEQAIELTLEELRESCKT